MFSVLVIFKMGTKDFLLLELTWNNEATEDVDENTGVAFVFASDLRGSVPARQSGGKQPKFLSYLSVIGYCTPDPGQSIFAPTPQFPICKVEIKSQASGKTKIIHLWWLCFINWEALYEYELIFYFHCNISRFLEDLWYLLCLIRRYPILWVKMKQSSIWYSCYL